MKKFMKLLSVVFVVCCLACAFAFAGCGNGSESATYQGEYTYNQYGTDYGIKVEVTVEDNVIKSVVVLASEYTEATSEEYWTNKSVWDDGLNNLLASYEGKTVSEVLAVTVECNDDGSPKDSQTYEGLVITGATVGSGRLVLAVQDALKKI